MDVPQRAAQLKDALSIKVVYGDPIERDGVTVIPAALVAGGGGAGGGTGPDGGGEGLGYGLWARPVGAYVIKDGSVRWVPAVDMTIVVLASLGLVRMLARTWTRSRRHHSRH